MKVALEIDGTWYEAEANAKTFNGVASKQRFKERFGVPAAYLSVYTSLVDDDSEDIDWSKLTSAQMAALPDPDVAFTFLVWLELKRRCDGLPNDKWDDLLERITDGPWIDAGGDEGDADPSPQTNT